MKSDDLGNRLDSLQSYLADQLKKREETKTIIKHSNQWVINLTSEIEARETAHSVLRTSVEVMQTQVHKFLSKLVTRCLVSVLDDPYTFSIEFQNKKNSMEAHLRFERDGVELEKPKDSIGGGVLDLAAFALRVGAICLSGNDRVVVMDEGFRFVSEKYREPVREFMEALSHELGFQFIQVTHSEELVTGNVIRVE
jgi:DNA repair exonuclease SbcCD ATPase subunit